MKFLSVFFVILVICSCHSSSPNSQSNKLPSIAIQPFNAVDTIFTKAIYQHLIANSNNSILLYPSAALPKTAFLPERRRYSADSIIVFLSKRSGVEAQKVIGITNSDIETSVEGKKHWGVIGLGFCPGPSAIVSIHRLKKRAASASIVLNRAINVCLHEMGHNFKLPHCSNKTCLMVAANGGMPGDLVGAFCTDCLQTLHQNGWKYHQPPTTYSQHTENK